MITSSAGKFPLDPIFCLFECQFSNFLNACLIPFEVIMIMNELFPHVSSNHSLGRLRILLSFLVPSGSMQTLQKVQYMTSYFRLFATFLDPKQYCRNCVNPGTKRAKTSLIVFPGQKWTHLRRNISPLTGILIIFQWRVCKGMISPPVKGF